MIRRAKLERRIAEQLPLSPTARSAQRLMWRRGIDTPAAAELCAEVGDFHRSAIPSS